MERYSLNSKSCYFEFWQEMEVEEDGEWVRYEEALKEINEVKAELARYIKERDQVIMSVYHRPECPQSKFLSKEPCTCKPISYPGG